MAYNYLEIRYKNQTTDNGHGTFGQQTWTDGLDVTS